MVARIYYYEESLARATTTSTTYASKVSKTFTPTANKTYAIIWSAITDGNSTEYQTKVRIQNTTATVTLAEEIQDTRHATIATSNTCAGGIALFAPGASPVSTTMDMQFATANVAMTTGIREARLLILELIDSVDIWNSETGQTTTSSTTYAAKISLSWTPATAGDYLTLFTAEHDPVDTKIRLNIDAGTFVGENTNHAYNHINNYQMYAAAYRHVGISGAHTASLEWATTVAVSRYMRNAYGVALRLDQFDDRFWTDDRTEASSTSATFVDKGTITGTPSAIGAYMLLACGNVTTTDGTYTTSSASRIAVGGTGQGTESSQVGGGAGFYRNWFQVLNRYEAASSTTWTTQYARTMGAGTARSGQHVLAVLRLSSQAGINTAGKRASVQACSGGASALVGYLGSASGIDVSDRAHITELYRGIAYGPQQAIFTPSTGAVIADGLQPAFTLALAPALAAVALAGQQGGLSWLLTPALAAVTASGNAPSLSLTIALQPTTSVVTATGLAPTIGGSTNLQPATGVVAVIGLVPSITRTLTASIAPVAFSGLQTTILKGLSPSLGAAVATGIAPSLSVTRYLDPPLGAVAVTGIVPSISVTRYLAASTGAVVTTGNAPSLGSTIPLAPTAGAVAATGVAPSLLHTLVALPGAVTTVGQSSQLSLAIGGVLGTVAVAGNAPTLSVLQLITIAPSTGVVTTVGNAATLTQILAAVTGAAIASGQTSQLSKLITAVTGTVTTAGNVPALSVLQLITLTPTTGAAVTSGVAPSLVSTLAASAGSVVTTGVAVTLSISLTAQTGAAVLTGNQPTFGGLAAIAPSTGVVSAVGLAPTLIRVLETSQSAITVTGNAPTLGGTIALVPSAAIVTAIGIAASTSLTLAGIAGSVILVGDTPAVNVLQFIELQAQTGAVSIAGNMPALDLSLAGSPGAAVVSGIAPTLALTNALEPTLGAIAASGAVPSKSLALLPTTGVITVDGNAPQLLIAGILVLEASTGAAVVIGNQPFIPVVTKIPPDVILVGTNLAGIVANIREDPTSPDGSWLTATDATALTDLRVSFEDPPPISPPDGVQNFLAYVRKTAGAPNPTVDVELWQNGSYVATLLNDTSITSASGELLTASWSSTALTGTLDGTDVEFRIVSTPADATGPGTLPAYDGTGQAAAVTSATITTAITPAIPSTCNAGDLLILQVLARNTNNNGAGPASIANWTAFAGNPYGGTNNSRQSLYWRIASAGLAGTTVSVTCTGGTSNDLAMARIYRFTAADGFAATPIEGITINAGTASPIAAPVTGATPGGINRRAVCVGAIASSDSTIGNMTGESGGDWTEFVNANSTVGGDGSLNVQMADASTGTAISGGSVAFNLSTGASEHWNTVAFYLVPVDVTAAVNTVEIGAVEWDALLGPRTLILAAVAGAVAATGLAPSLVKEIVPALGAVSITGNIPGLSLSRELVPDTGVVSAAGNTPAITYALAPSPAAISAAGLVPTLLNEFAATSGMVSAVGLAPSLLGTFLPTTEAVSAAGNVPSVTYAGQLIPFTGTIDATGIAPSLVNQLLPGLGTLTFAGNAPTVASLVTTILLPSTGAVATAGLAPTLTRTFLPQAAAATLAGIAPALARSIAAVTGQTIAIGNAPTIGLSYILEPFAASVTTDGNIAAISFGLQASLGSVAVAGQSPGLLNALGPSTGTIDATGVPGVSFWYNMQLSAEMTAGVQLQNQTVSLVADLLVFNFNPFLPLPTGDRVGVVLAEDRTGIVLPEDRVGIVPVEIRVGAPTGEIRTIAVP